MNLNNYLILDSNNNPIDPESYKLIKKSDYEEQTSDIITLKQLLSLLPEIQQ